MTAIAARPASHLDTVLPQVQPEPDLDRDGLFEFVDGQLIEKNLGLESNWIAGQVAFFLQLHLREKGDAGLVILEQTFRCFAGQPDQIRRPDIAFIAAARVPIPWPDGHLSFAPDIAVEVSSPTDLVKNLERKLDEYRSVGVHRTRHG
jgi:Uma2 family endonuclease